MLANPNTKEITQEEFMSMYKPFEDKTGKIYRSRVIKEVDPLNNKIKTRLVGQPILWDEMEAAFEEHKKSLNTEGQNSTEIKAEVAEMGIEKAPEPSERDSYKSRIKRVIKTEFEPTRHLA